VLWRSSGEDLHHVWTLGGNENDIIQIEALPRYPARSFGFIGYWWLKSEQLPATGAGIDLTLAAAKAAGIDGKGLGELALPRNPESLMKR
jgi:hypothetical protein